jgi:class 3 adenylate cyclase/HAMP domain-containing protein
MKIRSKIILVVLPLIIVTLFLAELASYFSAVSGVTRIARQFLSFKAGELEKYMESQWDLLLENNYAGRPDMIEAAKAAIGSYAESIILSDTERIFAVGPGGDIEMATGPIELSPEEKALLSAMLEEESQGMLQAVLGGKNRVFRAFYFTPFRWYTLCSEESAAFYHDAERIRLQTITVLSAASVIAVILLVVFSGRLTNPLGRIIKTMNGIIAGGELSSRVEVEYQDETGKLAHTFNLMLAELERAYKQIKHYAFDAVLAGKKEQRIRQIFQKYVPTDVIDESFKNPEHMLPPRNMDLAILFSDIRSFTTIAESIGNPRDLVEALNRYFSPQVDIIYRRRGIVDKYIGDAIMALWGAPVKHEDDALQAALSALEMLEGLKVFNEEQARRGKVLFKIGIGINYGEVTVGNLGGDQKRDYSVIGDNVNLASRMEGLTKTYHSELLITENLYGELRRIDAGTELHYRHLDNVMVKGKKLGVKIYTVKQGIGEGEKRAWALHDEAMELYFPQRAFAEAAAKFREVLTLLPEDFNAAAMEKRCAEFALNPPPPDWDGAEVMKTK